MQDYSDKSRADLINECRTLRQEVHRLRAKGEQNEGASLEGEPASEHLEMLARNTHENLWAMDEDMVYTYISPRVQDMLGYAPEEVVGRRPFDFMPAREARLAAEAFEEFKRQARVFTAYENHRWHRDGWLVTLETSGRPVYQDGKMVGFRGVDRDVTARERARKRLQRAHQELARRVEDRTSELREINRRLSREIEQRRAAETALRQSEKRYRNLMENLPLDAFILKNNPLRFVYLNFDRSRLLGYPAEDLLQWPEERIREKIHPDDREKVITRLDQRFRGERPGSETYECRLYAEDGAVHWVRLFVSRVTFQDEAAIQTVVVDVTQNKREKKRLNTSTHRLQQLLDAGDVGRAWIDEQMRVVNMNSTLRERAGWTEPETDPPCTSVLCRAAGHNLCGDECPVKKAFREETPQKAVDTIEAGDEISVLQVVAVPEEDDDGRMVQALVTTMRLSSDR